MKHTCASAEHLNQLKQTLQEINNLLPLLPVPDADTPQPSDTQVADLLMPHQIHLSEMIEAFRQDVNLYLHLSERSHSQPLSTNPSPTT